MASSKKASFASFPLRAVTTWYELLVRASERDSSNLLVVVDKEYLFDFSRHLNSYLASSSKKALRSRT
jgi:hypothetical protein